MGFGNEFDTKVFTLTPPDRIGLMVETSHPQVIGLDRGNPGFLGRINGSLGLVHVANFSPFHVGKESSPIGSIWDMYYAGSKPDFVKYQLAF